jgi:putative transposase
MRTLDGQRVHRAAVALAQIRDVYLKGYSDGREARAGIASLIAFYNGRRPHQALADRTPMAVWPAGVAGPIGANAVDTMDNARALPTCPQQHQQKQTTLFAP